MCVTLPACGSSKQVCLTLPPSNKSVCLHERDKCVWLHDREGWYARGGHEREGWCGRGGLRQGTGEEAYERRGTGEEGYGRRGSGEEGEGDQKPTATDREAPACQSQSQSQSHLLHHTPHTTHHTRTLSPPLDFDGVGVCLNKLVQGSVCKAAPLSPVSPLPPRSMPTPL